MLPKYANTPYIQISDFTSFGLIDIIAAMMDKAGSLSSENGIMSVIDPPDDDDNDAKGTEDT